MNFLFLLLALSGQTLAINCPNLWSNGFPDQGRTRQAFECNEFAADSRFQLYYSNFLNREEISSLLEAARESLQRSIEVYQGLGSLPHIKAILYHNPSFKDESSGNTTYAEAFVDWYRTPSESCPVIIYPAAQSFSADYFKQLMAHEIFHCFQEANVQAQSDNGTQRGIGTWWLEGIAQYFSNVVYPNVDLEYSSMFDPYQPMSSLINQQYGNVHFFQSWANHSSNADLLNFMRSMPGTSSPSQGEALASIANIEERLHMFAKEMITAGLRDSSGREAPLAPLDPLATFEVPSSSDDWTTEIPVTAFTVNYYKLHLPEKARFRIQMRGLERVKISLKHQDETTWRELDTDIETPCDLDETYDLAITYVDSNSDALEAVTLVVSQEEKEECPCNVDSRPRDECLYGTWDVDESSVRAFYERMMSGTGSEVRIVNFSATMSVTFNRDGSGTMNSSNWRVHMEMDSGREIITLINEIWGETTWKYTTHGRGNICSEDVTNNLQGKSTMTIAGHTQTVPFDRRMFAGASIGRNFTYECQGNQMIYKTVIGVGPGGSNLDFNYLMRKR